MRMRIGGFSLIIGATVVAGIAGYLVTFLVYRQLGPDAYAVFAVFWATLYLVVGGLSGIQQEITRASHAIEPGTRERASRARTFGLLAAGAVFVLVVGTAPLWAHAVFPASGWGLVWPLAVGASSYVLVAVLSGSLYGISQWRSLALMIAFDGVLRLVLVAVAAALTDDLVVVAWLVALPFPLAILLLWPVIRGGLVGRSDLDAGYRTLTWNVARTILASVSTAVLVSGFPLLIGVASDGVPAALLGELIFTLTLTRAPLIVTVMSLQSFFVVRFRDAPERSARLLVVLLAVVLAGGAILSALAWWLGPAVFALVSGGPTTIAGEYIAVLVVSSALVGALCLTAAAVLARAQHFVYSLGWVAGAVVTIVAMALPLEFSARVVLALLAGPVAGLAVHAAYLIGSRSSAARS